MQNQEEIVTSNNEQENVTVSHKLDRHKTPQTEIINKILDCLKTTDNQSKVMTVVEIVQKTKLNHVSVVKYLNLIARIQREFGVFILETPKTPIAFSIPSTKLVNIHLRQYALNSSYTDMKRLLEVT